MTESTPLVTVVMLTYGHEAYVEQAIDSVLDQQTDFAFELVISEDCSVDRTRELVLARAAAHPEHITVLLSERNQNDQEVFLRALRRASGEFIAYLDGDDWWSSPHKLARQVAHLRAHPEQSACFSAADVVGPDGAFLRRASHDGSLLDTATVLGGTVEIKSCTPLFRASAVKDPPEWFGQSFYTDWPLYLVASLSGPIGYIDEALASYRKVPTGVWSGSTRIQKAQRLVDFYDLVGPTLTRPLRRLVRTYRAGAWAELATALARDDQLGPAARAAVRSFVLAPLHPRSPWDADGRVSRARAVAGAGLRRVGLRGGR